MPTTIVLLLVSRLFMVQTRTNYLTSSCVIVPTTVPGTKDGVRNRKYRSFVTSLDKIEPTVAAYFKYEFVPTTANFLVCLFLVRIRTRTDLPTSGTKPLPLSRVCLVVRNHTICR